MLGCADEAVLILGVASWDGRTEWDVSLACVVASEVVE